MLNAIRIYHIFEEKNTILQMHVKGGIYSKSRLHPVRTWEEGDTTPDPDSSLDPSCSPNRPGTSEFAVPVQTDGVESTNKSLNSNKGIYNM